MTGSEPLAVHFDDVAAAARRIEGVAHRTPVITSRRINSQVGAEFFFKPENLQRTGSFKFRGAYNAVSQAAADGFSGVVAFSSGNHAQAVALAAQLHGLPATIVMPEDAPTIKAAATEGYGATIVRYDRYTESRDEIAASIAEQSGRMLVPPFDLPHVIAGQGTVAKELIEDVGDLDALYVCVGGGGLISGCATAAKHLSPDCTVVGGEPAAGDDAKRSLESGSIVTIEVPDTIADGAQTTAVGKRTFPIMVERVDRIEAVSDAELVAAMVLMAETTKLVIEPTGALALAAALADSRAGRLPGPRVGVVLSGGNVEMPRYVRLLEASGI